MIELLSAEQRDAVIGPMLREHLQPLGLTELTPRRWIDDSKPPVRKLFELCLLKGAGLEACGDSRWISCRTFRAVFRDGVGPIRRRCSM